MDVGVEAPWIYMFFCALPGREASYAAEGQHWGIMCDRSWM